MSAVICANDGENGELVKMCYFIIERGHCGPDVSIFKSIQY